MKSSDEKCIRLAQAHKGTKKTLRLNNHFKVHVGERPVWEATVFLVVFWINCASDSNEAASKQVQLKYKSHFTMQRRDLRKLEIEKQQHKVAGVKTTKC